MREGGEVMAGRDQTRNIPNTQRDTLNEFDFQKHHGEITEQEQHSGSGWPQAKPQTRAEQVAGMIEAAKAKARKRQRKSTTKQAPLTKTAPAPLTKTAQAPLTETAQAPSKTRGAKKAVKRPTKTASKSAGTRVGRKRARTSSATRATKKSSAARKTARKRKR